MSDANDSTSQGNTPSTSEGPPPVRLLGIGHPNFIFYADFAPDVLAETNGISRWFLKVETVIPVGDEQAAKALQEKTKKLPGDSKDFLDAVEPLIEAIKNGKDKARVKRMVRGASE